MTREELLPCPFCGGKPTERIADNSLVVSCRGCGVEMTRLLVPPAEWELAALRCREAWNERKEARDGR